MQSGEWPPRKDEPARPSRRRHPKHLSQPEYSAEPDFLPLESYDLAGMGAHPKADTHAAFQGLLPVTAPTHPDAERLQAILRGMKDFPATEPNRLGVDDLRAVGS